MQLGRSLKTVCCKTGTKDLDVAQPTSYLLARIVIPAPAPTTNSTTMALMKIALAGAFLLITGSHVSLLAPGVYKACTCNKSKPLRRRLAISPFRHARSSFFFVTSHTINRHRSPTTAHSHLLTQTSPLSSVSRMYRSTSLGGSG